ncbi:MAG: rhomboid family intramembrane serine protease [Saprospiraceae bacterium]|nr:rhomboid family intramembrane serine protease [Saprospiraceae bacterium]
MPITYIIIAVTSIVSFLAFSNQELFQKLKHWPYQEARQGEYYRWLTSGFLHGDFMHLIFNMLTLYFFGPYVENWFISVFPSLGATLFLVFYLVSIVAASVGTFYKFRDASYFSSIGASGAVAAVLFASILLDPTIGIMIFFIPIPIPGFIFGPLYLWYSSYAANKGGDNIDHTAHFFGAVFGFFFPLLLQPSLFLSFFEQVVGWFRYTFGG